MSAGQSTYFCKNGHLVYDTREDEVYYDAKIEICSVCGTAEIQGCHEWHDKEYGSVVVPYEPLRVDEEFIPKPASLKIYQRFLDGEGGVEYTEVERGNFFIKKQTLVYNVKKLFKEEKS